MALADAGNLPLYGDLDKETRQRCEDAGAWARQCRQIRGGIMTWTEELASA